MNEILLNITGALVTFVLIPVIGFAGQVLIKWLAQKTKNEKLASYLAAAANVVVSAVRETMQTYVDSLKKSGAFTPEAQAAAFQKAKETAAAQISAEIKSLITENHGGFDKWLETQIEAAVNMLKYNH